MFRRALLPTDFSDCANKVLVYLKELKNAGLEEVILIRVINLARVVGVTSGFDIEAWIKDEEKESAKRLEELVDQIKGMGIKARYVSPIPAGDPVSEIVKAAEKEDVSFILMASRGKGILKEILLGSVSEGVVRRATRPVIVVKVKKKKGNAGCEPRVEKLFDRILYAHDLSEHSQKILDYVRHAALSGGKDVILLHVREEDEDYTVKLEEVKRELEKDGINVKIMIKDGVPHKQIIRTAKEEGVTLIMMSSRGLGFVEGMLLGSTTDAVVRHSDIPVFIHH
ncbi:universal stress protein [Archaeoglobus veneficus]|nr:universal stress protein [Archaeoglobus veneficus]